MRRVEWGARKVGDIYLTAVPGILHDAIWDAELAAHPGAPVDFQASHAGIVGPFDGYVTEAWLSKDEGDSVACVVPAAKYNEPASLGQVEVYRADATDQQAYLAFQKYLHDYAPQGYGWENLLGFLYRAEMKKLIGVDIENPIYKSNVCSQGALLFARDLCDQGCTEAGWAWAADIKNMDPLALRMAMNAQ